MYHQKQPGICIVCHDFFWNFLFFNVEQSNCANLWSKQKLQIQSTQFKSKRDHGRYPEDYSVHFWKQKLLWIHTLFFYLLKKSTNTRTCVQHHMNLITLPFKVIYRKSIRIKQLYFYLFICNSPNFAQNFFDKFLNHCDHFRDGPNTSIERNNRMENTL